MDIRFFAPSYRRSKRSITQKRYPQVTLIVAESEADAYREQGNRVETCPDAVQGNVCRVRNWIIEQNADADCVVIVDDDCRCIGRFVRKGEIYTEKHLDADELTGFAEHATVMAQDMGVKLWGVNCVPDKQAYRESMPFSFVSYIGSPMTGHVKTDLFFDEQLPLKEDYDLTLQHLNRHRRVLRFNAYFYRVKQAQQAGGCAAYRNLDREREQFERLQRKWGRDIIWRDYGSKRSFDFNPIMKTPIKGV